MNWRRWRLKLLAFLLLSLHRWGLVNPHRGHAMFHRIAGLRLLVPAPFHLVRWFLLSKPSKSEPMLLGHFSMDHKQVRLQNRSNSLATLTAARGLAGTTVTTEVVINVSPHSTLRGRYTHAKYYPSSRITPLTPRPAY
ncbi:uncharacterized protein BDR25DRAFT_348004 [Lindgomyces ingoldianus]|uniref:Uncharacterized protein n=1 Tax=Lindgomyces ingoldianus TaxID=673940 RepID=A0ACB6RH59_9PLEO|nr:uncharacterized protein BDR25DRAFT_348004 [Lindgomyces ingoldianus]KAF2477680.1 hypothetical protein BDR25DRAFT_348004 [Lindgomyces ingoldianus]